MLDFAGIPGSEAKSKPGCGRDTLSLFFFIQAHIITLLIRSVLYLNTGLPVMFKRLPEKAVLGATGCLIPLFNTCWVSIPPWTQYLSDVFRDTLIFGSETDLCK